LKVSADRLEKSFGDVVAVDGVSLEVEDGEFLVLLGPSGCGKTTTLRIMAGLERADSGHVYIGEQCVDDLPPKDRDIAMVFQDYALYSYMSIFQNIAFPLKVRRQLSKVEIAERVRATARQLEIEHLLDRRPTETSGGERQRVALARAIIRQPRAFLLDEPLSNIDAKLRVLMRAELKVLHRRLQTATICVSHDQLDAMTLGTRIAIMDRGQVRQIGTPLETYTRPVDLFVASFLGMPPINLIEAQLNGSGGVDIGTGLDRTAVKLPPPVLDAAERHASQPDVILGIRPEQLQPTYHLEDGILQGDVYVVEPIGSDQYAYVTLATGERVISRAEPRAELTVDTRIAVKWNLGETLVFDKVTGLRIAPS